ncbi:MAG: hypothetical protein HY074_16885, partial [Deltaproteobacteria bacterium]|nr:hypothetical protein [Deltaproteobacteria bacterium]
AVARAAADENQAQEQISKEQADINKKQADTNSEQEKRAGQADQAAEQQKAEQQKTEAQVPGTAAPGTTVGITNFALRPEVGSIFYNGTQKFTGGVLMDFNVMSTPWVKIGPAVGALYSSTAPGNFMNGVSTASNDNIFQLPGDLKLTVSPDAEHRLNLGVHGGVDVIRSTPSSATAAGAFGGKGVNQKNIASTTTASWDLHPNVGADLDYALSTNVDLTLRPDVTFLSDFNMITATVGLGLKL